jgi:hypothetical protein
MLCVLKSVATVATQTQDQTPFCVLKTAATTMAQATETVRATQQLCYRALAKRFPVDPRPICKVQKQKLKYESTAVVRNDTN